MWKGLFLIWAGFLLVLSEAKLKYDGYQVYRVTAKNEKQIEKLKQLERSGLYDFWKTASNVNEPADIMVSPKKLSKFQRIIQDYQFLAQRTIEDVQKLINVQAVGASGTERAALDFTSYPTLQQIYDWIDNLPSRFSNTTVTVVTAGNSYEGRPIKGVKISFTPGVTKRGVFLEGGIHAREWISPSTLMYMTEKILSSNGTERISLALYDWHIFPMANPDGYKYSQEVNRFWRKNRQPWTNFPILRRICVGTDINRNWDYHWSKGYGSSGARFMCSDTYKGSKIFSTPEALGLSNYIGPIGNKLAVYLSFHSYGQFILLPYGDNSPPPENSTVESDVGTAAAKSLKNKYGTEYKVGSNIDLIKYYTIGVSSDWVKSKFKTPIVLGFELRDNGTSGFLLPADKIIPSGEETYDAVVTIVQQSAAKGFV